jgi:signal transduction histidine kinase
MSDFLCGAKGTRILGLPGSGLLICFALSSAAVATGAESAPKAPSTPYRVLVLSSFGSGFEIFSPMISVFRNELAHVQGGAVDFFDVPLELARFDDADGQEPFVGYLAALFASRRLDLVVTLGGPAASFAQTYRARLFPETPLLLASVESRLVEAAKLGPRDAVVPVTNDLAAVPAMALELLPKTEHLAIVLGSAPLERFWRDQLARALAPLEGRVQLIWLEGLPVDELLARVGTLPPHTAVYFVMVLLDGAGVPQFQNRVLTRLRNSANAPIFGLFDSQVGLGVVGGRMLPMTLLGRQTAEAASRLLAGAAPADVRYPPIAQVSEVFDSRELVRWGIPESQLPAGSEVRFRSESPWRTYRWQILGVVALLGLETFLIAFLVIHRARRRIAEREVRALHGRLLTTYEQERRRLARELHDDLTQRIARLAIDAAQVERLGASAEGTETLRLMRDGLVRLSNDVHSLSHQLHPAILDDLGLADAVRSEGERFARTENIEVSLRLEETPPGLSGETALCLYRVAQEALRNVAHHARARRVAVVLRSVEGALELGVSDDGVGIDPGARRGGTGLGHVSLRERLHLVGGQLEITSVPGEGTIVFARVPLP